MVYVVRFFLLYPYSGNEDLSKYSHNIFYAITKRTLYKSLQIHQDENIIFFSLYVYIAFAVIKIFFEFIFSPPSECVCVQYICFALMLKIELIRAYRILSNIIKTKRRLKKQLSKPCINED